MAVSSRAKQEKFEPILPGPKDWPVVQLSKHRKEFVQEVSQTSFDIIKKNNPTTTALIEELEGALYREKLRMRAKPWKVDPEDEQPFWNNIKKQLASLSGSDDTASVADQILRNITDRYAEEIAGNFKPSSYKFARGVATFGFARLLNATRKNRITGLFKNTHTLRDKIQIHGEVNLIRKLAKEGTIVMVPTHFSNLDSILVGWVIDELGLPPFIYGAGLNLFNMSLFAYFMNSLGAYKVDRRKKNAIYLETLKSYSNLAIQKGCHSLFFPGGTRSRSGRIENRLKLGLLGTTLEAQRTILSQSNGDQNKKVFIVPVTLNYNFVLEAPVLIKEWLQREGQERYYIELDEFSKSSKILKFLIKFFTKGSSISVSIGSAMDLLGNYVDEQGRSIGKNGSFIDIKDYFTTDGKIVADPQREKEYTRMLSQVIVKEFHRINRAFPSQLVAFVAFEMLKKRFSSFDLFNLLRLPEEEVQIEYEEFKTVFERVRQRLFELSNNDKIGINTDLEGDVDAVIKTGLKNVGMYHAKRPLLRNKAGRITTEDLNTLYFYHNKLDGYNLEEYA